VKAILKNEERLISSKSFLDHYLLLIFYPQNLAKKNELLILNENISKFDNLNAMLVGCSNDNKFSHANLNRTLDKDCITFHLIGDDKKRDD